MKTLKKWATMIGAVTMLVSIFSFAAPMPKVEAAVANGSDPIATGCARDAITVPDWNNTSWFSSAEVELRYSPSCRSAWAKLTLGGDPAITSGNARITRNDGVSYSCSAQKSLGKNSCYTRQVNDAGYTLSAS
ncbi:YjfA family protein [Bacillus sp. F19]|nr:YjfA family protein [Bacillus sp. F19]